MIVTIIGFLCHISGQSAKRLTNQSGENWLNSHLNADRPPRGARYRQYPLNDQRPALSNAMELINLAEIAGLGNRPRGRSHLAWDQCACGGPKPDPYLELSIQLVGSSRPGAAIRKRVWELIGWLRKERVA